MKKLIGLIVCVLSVNGFALIEYKQNDYFDDTGHHKCFSECSESYGMEQCVTRCY